MSEENIGIWKSLFEFAQRVGADDPVNNASVSTSISTMTEENKKWLGNALAQYVDENDPIKLVKEQILAILDINLTNPTVEEQLKGVSALEILNDLCENIDNASDFIKVGGLKILTPLLASSATQLRALSAELVGNLSQNHFECQNILNELCTLNVLCELLEKDPEESVRVKALYGISSMVGQNHKVQADFVKIGGFRYLMDVCRSNSDRMKIKSLFLMSNLLCNNTEWTRLVLDMDILQTLIRLISDSTHVNEQVLTILSILINNCPETATACTRKEYGLKSTLERRISVLRNSEHTVSVI
uniref:Uncharacterized protein n=1 Tax=Romanomermis culicivorax TaxID=13658 RepID=A0A915KSG3_ROMCU